MERKLWRLLEYSCRSSTFGETEDPLGRLVELPQSLPCHPHLSGCLSHFQMFALGTLLVGPICPDTWRRIGKIEDTLSCQSLNLMKEGSRGKLSLGFFSIPQAFPELPGVCFPPDPSSKSRPLARLQHSYQLHNPPPVSLPSSSVAFRFLPHKGGLLMDSRCSQPFLPIADRANTLPPQPSQVSDLQGLLSPFFPLLPSLPHFPFPIIFYLRLPFP